MSAGRRSICASLAVTRSPARTICLIARTESGAAAQILHDSKTTTMRGELITDKAQVTDLYARCVESYGVKRAERAMGLGFRDHQMPTHDQFAEAVEQLQLRAIQFTPAT